MTSTTDLENWRLYTLEEQIVLANTLTVLYYGLYECGTDRFVEMVSAFIDTKFGAVSPVAIKNEANREAEAALVQQLGA
jgi:hypothetical protein